ncbi:MAG: HEAT repeat domain-containing protein, partial [Chloroflexota bacterium]
DPASVDPLIAMLIEEEVGLLYRVIKTLGYLGDQRAIKGLTQCLNHPDKKISWRASYAIRQIERR